MLEVGDKTSSTTVLLVLLFVLVFCEFSSVAFPVPELVFEVGVADDVAVETGRQPIGCDGVRGNQTIREQPAIRQSIAVRILRGDGVNGRLIPEHGIRRGPGVENDGGRVGGGDRANQSGGEHGDKCADQMLQLHSVINSASEAGCYSQSTDELLSHMQ